MCTDVLVIREESTKEIKKLKYIREKYPSRSVTFSKVAEWYQIAKSIPNVCFNKKSRKSEKFHIPVIYLCKYSFPFSNNCDYKNYPY